MMRVFHDLPQTVGKAGTDVWQAVTRPFVETWKFISDPFAGLRQKGEQSPRVRVLLN